MELTLDQALQKGVEAHKAGKVQEADRYYTAILKANPKHPDANHNLGVLAVGVGKVQEALPFFKTALETNSSIAQFWLSYIDALIKLERTDEAKAEFDKAKSKGAKGDGFNRLEQKLNQIEIIKKTQKSVPTQPNILDELKLDKAIKLAKKKKEDGLIEEAEKIYQDILKKFPKNKKALDGIKTLASKTLAKTSDGHEPSNDQLQSLVKLYSQGQYQETLTRVSELQKKFPGSVALYNMLGAVNHSLGKIEEAIKAFRKAVAIKPDTPEAYNNLGNALNDQGKFDQAMDAYKLALSINPDYAVAYNNIGSLLRNQEKLNEAIEAYKKAISIRPEYVEALNNMGTALLDQGKLEEAIQVYKTAISHRSDYAEIYYNMGNARKEQGRPQDAIQAYKKAISLKPNHAETYNNIGILLKDQGRMDEAVSSFQRAFELRSGIVPKDDRALAPGTNALYFELTNKCNFHCVFCPSDFQKRNIGSMDLELIKRLYTEASEKKLASTVNLHLMGEPTLHPKLIEILNFGAAKNIKTDLVTNGSTLVAKIVPKILGSLYGTITASHMTPTEETYHFRGKVGLSWEKYISNLRLLVREYMKRVAQGNSCKNDITIRVMSTMNTAANCTITETTREASAILKEWSEYVSSVEEELGMDRFERMDYNAHDLLKENGSASISYPLQKGIQLTFWRAFTFANTRVGDEYELEDNIETAYCAHPFTDVGVLWNGDVTLCCLDHDGELSVGNINSSSIEEIIQNDAAKKLRASMLGRCSLPSVCKTCQAKPVKRQNVNKLNSAIA